MYKQRSFFRFSREEIKHLLMAWFAISLAFGILNVRGGNFGFAYPIFLVLSFVVSAITVGIGFLLHELAHKYVAQKYGCWAEFRADQNMLIFAVLMAAFAGFLFAAPGAVFIHGYVTIERNGKISLAGPAVNLILAMIFLSLGIFIPIEIIQYIAIMGFRINSWLALFNMIPLGNFDGIKIWRWSKPAYLITIGIAVVLNFLI